MKTRMSGRRWMFGLAAAFAFAGTRSRLAAQDVTVAPLLWMTQAGAPDELPAFKHPLKLAFPAEVKSSPEIGYAVWDLFLDGKGKVLSLGAHATLGIYSRDPLKKTNETLWSPGRRNGTGVNTATMFAVIFNPASAAPDLPDSTPRLTQVTILREHMPEKSKPDEGRSDDVFPIEVGVDENGLVTSVDGGPDALRRQVTNATKNWRFAPARRNGRAVAARVRVPFVVTWESTALPRAALSLPRAVFQKRPIYPYAMRASRMKGEVFVDFHVDIEGRVRNAFVSKTLNPSFNDAALDAVREWRFEPGAVSGKPVDMHMAVPIIFTLDETWGGGDGPLTVGRKADQSKLPEELRYDTPPVPVGTARPIYPYPMLLAEKDGSATVQMFIGPTGRVENVRIVEASAPEFGAALAAAVQEFVFQPAFRNSRPTSTVQGYEEKFYRDEMASLVHEEDLDLLRREKKHPGSIVNMRDLDDRLEPISQHPAKFPVWLGPEVSSGEALIEFLVDEEGRVRLPRIMKASADAFGYAAIQSVAAWRFHPPTRGGQGVAVRVRLPVTFSRPAPSSEQK